MWQPGEEHRNESGDVDRGYHSSSAAPHTIPKTYGATYSEDTSRQEQHRQTHATCSHSLLY